jgi:hypothetical protein
MLCVQDITIKELTQLVDHVIEDAARYSPADLRWLSGKAEQIGAILCAKDPIIERLRERAKKR